MTFSSESALDGSPTEPMDKATALALISTALEAIERLRKAYKAGELPTDLYSDCVDSEHAAASIWDGLAPLVCVATRDLTSYCEFGEISDQLLIEFGMHPDQLT